MKNFRYAKCCDNCDHKTNYSTGGDNKQYSFLCKINEDKIVFSDMVCDDFKNEDIDGQKTKKITYKMMATWNDEISIEVYINGKFHIMFDKSEFNQEEYENELLKSL